jgi:regulator of RNase E activity RraA
VPLREDLLEAQYSDLARSPHRLALETLEPGQILVVDVAGTVDTGVLGDMFARRIRERGGIAVVIDGAIRDLAAVREVGLPVFARGIHGGGIPRTLMSAGRDELIRCGGITVAPGDVVVADSDGVVAIPPHVATQLAQHSFAHAEQERWMRLKLEEGGSLSEYYPPTPEHEAEMLAWLADRKRKRDGP